MAIENPRESIGPVSLVDGMTVVDAPALFPGSCCLSNSGTGPFLDLGRVNNYGDRLYVASRMCIEIATAIGWVPAVEKVQSEVTNRNLRQTLANAEAELDQVQAELDNLKAAVNYTFQKGAVIQKESDPENPGRRVDVPHLRQRPGLPNPVL